MFILIDAQKSFHKIQHLFFIKTLRKLSGIKVNVLNMIKVIYEKPTANVIIDGEQLKLPKTRTEMGMPILPLLFNTSGSIQRNKTRQRKKRHPDWKGRSKTSHIHR